MNKENLSQQIKKYATLNRYNLSMSDINKMVIIDRTRFNEEPFWRNDVNKSYCISKNVPSNNRINYDAYSIIFYDENAPKFAGEFKVICNSYADMCNYNFNLFFDEEEIENEIDLQLHIELINTINWLLDKKIISKGGII